jgi:hypothetical protein
MSSKDFVDTQLDFAVREERTAIRDTVREDRAKVKADELALIRARLASGSDGNVSRAADKVVTAGGRAMSNEDWESFTQAVRRVAANQELDMRLAGLQEQYEKRALGTRVVKESRVYGEFSPWSYFMDRVTIAEGAGDPLAAAASSRITKYDAELKHEIRSLSREGRRAQRLIGEFYRQDVVEVNRRVVDERQAEARALSTGGGALSSAGSGAAAFVTPYFVEEAFAPWRGIHRTVSDQCAKMPMPSYGLQVYIPAFTSAPSVTQQTEAGAVSETDPSTGLQSAQVQMVTGQITLSQQLSDRGFTGGGSFDVALGKQLQQQLAEAIEKYVISQVLANAATVAGSSSFSLANLYADIAKGREVLTDTAGTRLRPTHFFSSSDFFSYVTRQVDDQHRPICVPTFAPGFPIAAGDEPTAKWSRFTGMILPGSLLWFEADGIPNVGTTSETQLIVSAPDQAVVLFEGDPVLNVFPQTDAASFEVVANLRAYVAAVTRYPSGTAAITGAAYTSALV